MMLSYGLNAQVAVTNDGSSADPSAMMDVKSSDKGMLIPRMAQTDIEAITNPANGLTVYNTDDCKFYVYRDCSSNWTEVALGAGTIAPTPPVGEVSNPTTGRIWMDKNLGAIQIATASNDPDAYGDLYQWGRAAEGHESRTSGTTSTTATTAVPNDGNSWDGLFITSSSVPFPWLTPEDNTLWQGVSGTNNPCPSGYRLPTTTELNDERLSWSSSNAAGAFASPLKLSANGYRIFTGGLGSNTGVSGYYWGSTTSTNKAVILYFGAGNSSTPDAYRSYGHAVRCIKD